MLLLWCQGDLKLHFVNEIIQIFMHTVIKDTVSTKRVPL
jgi:hypothetical protein